MIYILISTIGLYIISAGLLEVDLFFGLVFPLANKSIYFIFGLFIILFFLVSFKTNFKFVKLPVELILIFFSYFLFIVLEAIASIGGGVGTKTMETIIIHAIISTMTVILVYNYCYFKMSKIGDPFTYFVKPYIYFSVYIALTGIIAWILITFLIVDPLEWLLPEGLFKQDTASFKLKGHVINTMPYGLGLVRFGQGGIDIQNLIEFLVFIPRASGLAREPHMMAIFLTPALFLIPFIFDSKENRSFIKFSRLILITFLLVLFSGTNLIILSSFVLLYFVRSLFIVNRHISTTTKLLVLSVIFITLFVLIVESNILNKIKSLSVSNTLNFLFGNLNNITMWGTPYYTQISRGLFSLLAQLLHLSIFAFLLFKNIFSRNVYFIPLFAPMYVLMHSMKTYQHLGFDPFYIFNMFILVMIIDRLKKENKKNYILSNT